MIYSVSRGSLEVFMRREPSQICKYVQVRIAVQNTSSLLVQAIKAAYRPNNLWSMLSFVREYMTNDQILFSDLRIAS
jgi:hypothetical protein